MISKIGIFKIELVSALKHNWGLVGNEDVNHRVEIVEKTEEVKGHFAPALVHGEVETISIHDGRGIVQAGLRHSAWAFRITPNVVYQLYSGYSLYRAGIQTSGIYYSL